MKNIAVLILAAGKSSRMHSIKQLEKINNKTLLDITLEKAKRISPTATFCVLGANSDQIKQGITIENIDILYGLSLIIFISLFFNFFFPLIYLKPVIIILGFLTFIYAAYRKIFN